jgi:hypothetical protein
VKQYCPELSQQYGWHSISGAGCWLYRLYCFFLSLCVFSFWKIIQLGISGSLL